MQNNNGINLWFKMLQDLLKRVLATQDFNQLSNVVLSVCNSYGYPATGISLGTNRIVFDSPFPMTFNGQQIQVVAKVPLLGHQGFADNAKEIHISNTFAQHGVTDIIAPTVGVVPTAPAQPQYGMPQQQNNVMDTSIILSVKVARFTDLATFKANEALYDQWVERCKQKGVLVSDASKRNFNNFGIMNGKMVALDYPSFMAVGRPLTCSACGGQLSIGDLSQTVGSVFEGYNCSNPKCTHSPHSGAGYRSISYDTLVKRLFAGQ